MDDAQFEKIVNRVRRRLHEGHQCSAPQQCPGYHDIDDKMARIAVAAMFEELAGDEPPRALRRTALLDLLSWSPED